MGGGAWSQVAIGGGGYVMQTYFTSTGPVYMRTDVGGLYRRETDGPNLYHWTPLLDWAGPSQSALYSVNAFAFDPRNGSSIVALSGP
jgi:hypothetical protein